MEDGEFDVKNEGEHTLTYMPWYEHVKDFFLSQWARFFISWVGLFGIFWGLIEAASFFHEGLHLNNIFVLACVVVVGFCASAIHCIYIYRRSVPKGLEHESSETHRIAFSKRNFWEYALAHELIKSRIYEIDRELDDIINNRSHIKITRVMSAEQYTDWLQTRPENLIKIVDVTKQLLIFDLVAAIQALEDKEVDYRNLIRIAELIKRAYKSAYDFEVEGREIKVPDDFEVVHEIQAGWVSVIRDGFHQMLEILRSVAARDKGDFSPLDKTIVFESPPRIDEFCDLIDGMTRRIRMKD